MLGFLPPTYLQNPNFPLKYNKFPHVGCTSIQSPYIPPTPYIPFSSTFQPCCSSACRITMPLIQQSTRNTRRVSALRHSNFTPFRFEDRVLAASVISASFVSLTISFSYQPHPCVRPGPLRPVRWWPAYPVSMPCASDDAKGRGGAPISL